MFAECDACDVTEESSRHPLVFVPHCLPICDSLVGEPECVGLYRSVVDKSKVGAHAMCDLPRNMVFGPWLNEDEEKKVTEEQPSSRWMRVRRWWICFYIFDVLRIDYCLDCCIMSLCLVVYPLQCVQKAKSSSTGNLESLCHNGLVYYKTSKVWMDKGLLL